MSEENTVEVENDDIGADIAAAFDTVEAKNTPETEAKPEEAKSPEGRDEKGRFAVKEKAEETLVLEKPKRTPPKAWAKDFHEKFSTLPDDVQEYVTKREEEAERRLSTVDSERRLGIDLKEVVTPYMATIQAEGGTVTGAVKDLLNTAYVLRTGSPQQKAAIVTQVIQQYGVDLHQFQGQAPQQYQQPAFDPNKFKSEIISDLRKQQSHDIVMSEINAFASNPENKHYSAVEPLMASIMSSPTFLRSGNAQQDLKDAYQQAIWADPSVRSILQSEQSQTSEEKRKTELESKRKAGSSVAGSPGMSASSTVPKNNSNTLEDDIRAAMVEAGW